MLRRGYSEVIQTSQWVDIITEVCSGFAHGTMLRAGTVNLVNLSEAIDNHSGTS